MAAVSALLGSESAFGLDPAELKPHYNDSEMEIVHLCRRLKGLAMARGITGRDMEQVKSEAGVLVGGSVIYGIGTSTPSPSSGGRTVALPCTSLLSDSIYYWGPHPRPWSGGGHMT